MARPMGASAAPSPCFRAPCFWEVATVPALVCAPAAPAAAASSGAGRRPGPAGRPLREVGLACCLLIAHRPCNQAPGSRHSCVFVAGACTVQLPPQEVLVPSDSFNVTLHRLVSGQEQVSLVDPQFLPRRHVKLDPPSHLQSNVSAGRCVLSWGVDPVLRPLTSLLSYELAFKRREAAWEQARHKAHILGVTWLTLEAAELEPGATYEARLRVQMAPPEPDEDGEEPRYWGQWSEWSRPVRFPAPPRPGGWRPPGARPDGALVPVSILLMTSLAYLLLKLLPRVKKALYQNVPSPAAFFQPLYSRHGGDFQTWAGGARLQPQDSDTVGPGTLEAIATLTCRPGRPWWPVGLQEEGTVLPEGRPEGPELPTAYLPQEAWSPADPAGPVREAGGSDYCTLSCCGAEHPSAPRGHTGASAPILAVDSQLPGNSGDAWQGGICLGASGGPGGAPRPSQP
ncbi:PREDICTED: interleukin-9 receptor-like [Condylura cristata]|uniref:interleukin-9 receptor-like n=1 Tax=Condylura cristata TaxID=143302 RepID=UPI000642FA30|nr:PREDICTED: interleukin-9 receptor-like [Condylura cristata]